MLFWLVSTRDIYVFSFFQYFNFGMQSVSGIFYNPIGRINDILSPNPSTAYLPAKDYSTEPIGEIDFILAKLTMPPSYWGNRFYSC
jgi:hypothetical protein